MVLEEAEKRKPAPIQPNGSFEVDEMQAYYTKGKPQVWASYGIERKTGLVIGISVGKRDLGTLKKTINMVLMTSPKHIYTDGCPTYKNLIPKYLHKPLSYFMSRVERIHLTVRNSLKMLNHKTLAFVRKPATLLACLKLLFYQ